MEACLFQQRKSFFIQALELIVPEETKNSSLFRARERYGLLIPFSSSPPLVSRERTTQLLLLLHHPPSANGHMYVRSLSLWDDSNSNKFDKYQFTGKYFFLNMKISNTRCHNRMAGI